MSNIDKNILTFSSLSLMGVQTPENAGKCVIEILDSHSTVTMRDVSLISDLFASQYGENYHSYVLRNPEKILESIVKGEWIAFMCKDEMGQLVAHAGLLKCADGHWKFARTVVKQSLQRNGLHKLLTNIRQLYLDALVDEGLAQTVSTEAVTSHTRTQRAFVQRGFVESGIFLEKYSDYFNKGFRESVVQYTKVIEDKSRDFSPLYVPESLKGIISHITKNVGLNRQIHTSCKDDDTYNGAEFSSNTVNFEDMSSVYFELSHNASPLPLLNTAESYKGRGAHYISVALHINHPSALKQLSLLIQAGYYFGGFQLRNSGDQIIMQWSQGCFLEAASRVELYSEGAQKILSLSLEALSV